MFLEILLVADTAVLLITACLLIYYFVRDDTKVKAAIQVGLLIVWIINILLRIVKS